MEAQQNVAKCGTMFLMFICKLQISRFSSHGSSHNTKSVYCFCDLLLSDFRLCDVLLRPMGPEAVVRFPVGKVFGFIARTLTRCNSVGCHKFDCNSLHEDAARVSKKNNSVTVTCSVDTPCQSSS